MFFFPLGTCRLNNESLSPLHTPYIFKGSLYNIGTTALYNDEKSSDPLLSYTKESRGLLRVPEGSLFFLCLYLTRWPTLRLSFPIQTAVYSLSHTGIFSILYISLSFSPRNLSIAPPYSNNIKWDIAHLTLPLNFRNSSNKRRYKVTLKLLFFIIIFYYYY